MNEDERLRLANLETAVVVLANAVEEQAFLHEVGWQPWRAAPLHAKLRALRGLVAQHSLTLPADISAGRSDVPT